MSRRLPRLVLLAWLLVACQPLPALTAEPVTVAEPSSVATSLPGAPAGVAPVANLKAAAGGSQQPTPFPTRPPYPPGELVDYTAQTGDTLPALAAHFNTTVDEILAANPFIPASATTMPPGMPMKIPIYYAPLWGSPYQIIPDSLFIDGPAQVGFDTAAFLDSHPGWFKTYATFASGANRSAAGLVDLVAINYSLSPRLLLALLEYQSGALSQAAPTAGSETYPLGYIDSQHQGPYLQLVWAANALNNAYYSFRIGQLQAIIHIDGTMERPDPWQNAATVALQAYFSSLLPVEAYQQAIGPDGLAATYRALFGDPWQVDQPHIPGSLVQPELKLPFEPGKTWAFTGGPHTGWGEGEPLAAIDFAPPAVAGGCLTTDEWVTAEAAGTIARSEPGVVVLDLDSAEAESDGDERTGWAIFHLHMDTRDRIAAGRRVKAGDRLGHPSCEGGKSTGTHVHVARKYNGEWMPAEGLLGFNLEGWIASNGAEPYQGTLTRFGRTVRACTCSDAASFITAGAR